MTLVVDASVAIKWFFEEPGSQSARALLDREEALIAPSLVLAEIANVAWKRLRRGEIARQEADEVIRLMGQPFTELTPVESLIALAARLAFDFARPVYDCLYCALAEREGAVLVTNDLRLYELARRTHVTAELVG